MDVTDSINGSLGNDQITGGNGTDTLTGGTGIDTFIYKNANEFGDTILDFLNGGSTPGADLIDFAASLVGSVLRGTGATFQTETDIDGAALGANTGLFVNQTAEADLSISTAYTQANTLTGVSALDVIYLVQSNGTDAAIFRVSETTSDTTFDSVEVVANLTDVSNTDLVALDGSSFSDFT